MVKKIGLILGPMSFIFLNFLSLENIDEKASIVIALASWMIIWWISEAVSISVTSLLPLVIFPLFQVMEINQVGANYGSSIVFLFFGRFVLALALEKVNLHKRIALTIINKTGTSPNRVILGFMIATAFMSMWISNTASTVVMLPIALSVINLLIDNKKGGSKSEKNFSLSVMLGIAFSANSGGIATVIGTPPNSVLIGLLENEYNIEISFLNWMVIGLPFSITLLAIIYFLLTRVLFRNENIKFKSSSQLISNKLSELGKLSKKEIHVLIIFGITVFLWIYQLF